MAGASSSNAKRGDQTRMGYENSSCNPADPYGVALDLTSFTDARICMQISPAFVADEVEFDTVGCGGTSGFGTDCEISNFEFRASGAGDAGFQNGYDRVLAQFYGASSAPAEQTPLEGDYLHVFSFSPTPNAHFGTLAWETSKDDVIELVSTFTESINISMASVGEPVRYTALFVANDAECDATVAVNDNADLQSLAFVEDEKIVPECAHAFRIKPMLDDGSDIALAAPADLVPITSFEADMERPLEVIDEMTGGDCNAPTEVGAITGTLTIGFKEHEDNGSLSYLDWKAGTTYQADIAWTGSDIASGEPLTHVLRFPKLCLVEAPDYNITDPGKNPYTLVFRILDSENTIPGFTGTTPEAAFINKRADIYLPV